MAARQSALMAFAALVAIPLASVSAQNQQPLTGTLSGTIVDSAGAVIENVIVEAQRKGDPVPHDATSTSAGQFRIPALPVGSYSLSAHRLGYKVLELPAVMIAAGQTTELTLRMVPVAAVLGGVRSTSSPVAIEKGSTEFATQIDANEIALLPMGRDASSLVALVPGATVDQMWGGGGQLANNFELDGVSVNHPGVGGDFLSPNIDWVQTLEVKGLGAGAANGNFQGGIVNVVTKTGSNVTRGTWRVNYEAPWITGSNFNLREQGSEQAGRQEIDGEQSGPIVHDHLFYFVAGDYINLDSRVPDLDSIPASRFRPYQTTDRTGRGMAKVTWESSAAGRIDLLLGFSDETTERFGLTGYSDPASMQRVVAPTTTYELAWTRPIGDHQVLDLRGVGYVASQTNSGYSGPAVPGIQVFSIAGNEPQYQNAAFTQKFDPTSLGLRGSWTLTGSLKGTDHTFQIGAEFTGGTWKDIETRNGGVTWFPSAPVNSTTTPFNPLVPATWGATGSEWGGDVYLNSEVASSALYAEDAISFGSHLTVTPGLRFGAWEGWLLPDSAPRFLAASATGFDPRLGFVYDVTGENDFVIKVHAGVYHQGMAASLFNRVSGSNAYQNTLQCEAGPVIANTRQAVTTAQQDSLCGVNGTMGVTQTIIQDETGPLVDYHQPYMDQLVIGVDKRFEDHWKLEGVYTNRQNHDFVGLVDRNAATDYSAVHNVEVFPDVTGYSQVVADPYVRGQPLVIPTVYIRSATFNPDYVFTTIPEATRQFRQFSLLLRGDYPAWTGLASFTETVLDGNVPGVLTDGGVGSNFTPGPWARPNEAINDYGELPGTNAIEAKGWINVKMPDGFWGGATVTHDLGERTTAYFTIDPSKFFFITGPGQILYSNTLQGIDGQTILLEPRGTHFYGDRTEVDLHIERRFVGRTLDWIVSGDLFNALDANTITEVKLQVDGIPQTNTTYSFGAPLLRMAPITLRLGARAAFVR